MKNFENNNIIWGYVFILIVFIIYWLPTFFGKGKFWKIFILNLLMGWTVVGWVVAFYWAGKKIEK